MFCSLPQYSEHIVDQRCLALRRPSAGVAFMLPQRWRRPAPATIGRRMGGKVGLERGVELRLLGGEPCQRCVRISALVRVSEGDG